MKNPLDECLASIVVDCIDADLSVKETIEVVSTFLGPIQDADKKLQRATELAKLATAEYELP
jgi:hypothetical protein